MDRHAFARATSTTSDAIRRNIAHDSGLSRISPMEARAVAVIPACAQMKASFSHITTRMSRSSRWRIDAAAELTKPSTRSLIRPSSSPNATTPGPPVCSTTPGAETRARGTQPHRARARPDRGPERVQVVDPVEERHDRGVSRHQRRDERNGVGGVVRLDAEQHGIDRPHLLGPVGRRGMHNDVARHAAHLQPAFADRAEVLSSCDEMHVAARLRKPDAEVAADAARADDDAATGHSASR